MQWVYWSASGTQVHRYEKLPWKIPESNLRRILAVQPASHRSIYSSEGSSLINCYCHVPGCMYHTDSLRAADRASKRKGLRTGRSKWECVGSRICKSWVRSRRRRRCQLLELWRGKSWNCNSKESFDIVWKSGLWKMASKQLAPS